MLRKIASWVLAPILAIVLTLATVIVYAFLLVPFAMAATIAVARILGGSK